MSFSRKPKTESLDKTLLTEIKCTLADVNMRKRLTGGSIAKRVGRGQSFIVGDETCGPTDDEAFLIGKVETAIIIQCFGSLKLKITYGTGELSEVPCSGLFVLYGQLDSIEVRSAAPTRFSYVRS